MDRIEGNGMVTDVFKSTLTGRFSGMWDTQLDVVGTYSFFRSPDRIRFNQPISITHYDKWEILLRSRLEHPNYSEEANPLNRNFLTTLSSLQKPGYEFWSTPTSSTSTVKRSLPSFE